MAAVHFRGSLAGHVGVAIILGLLAGVGAALLGPSLPEPLPPAFFTVGLVVGGGAFVVRWFVHHRRSGIILDDTGLAAAARPAARIELADIVRLRLATHAPHRLESKERSAFIRYAVVEGKHAELRFAQLRHAPPPHLAIIEVADSGLLLAVLAERLGTQGLLPEPTGSPPTTDEARASAPDARALARSWGILPLLFKLGPKLASLAAAGLKFVKSGAALVKPGWAAVSLAAYSLVFDWKFGLLLMFMIFWHEYGHVHAMRRLGVPVRGIYFVPFLGGVAVHNAPIRNRWHQVYVDLNGPLWGGVLSAAALGVWYGTGQDQPLYAAVAAWWALINLFNLLPILPLDGGRVLSAIAFSLRSSGGGLLVLLGILAGGVLGIMAHVELLAFMAVIGAIEFATEISAARWRRMLPLLSRPDRLDFATWRRLQSLTRSVIRGEDAPRVIAGERAVFERRIAIATATPMSRPQLAMALAGYALLAASLVAIIAVVRDVPGADLAALLLRG